LHVPFRDMFLGTVTVTTDTMTRGSPAIRRFLRLSWRHGERVDVQERNRLPDKLRTHDPDDQVRRVTSVITRSRMDRADDEIAYLFAYRAE
jgi:hypothetical protein